MRQPEQENREDSKDGERRESGRGDSDIEDRRRRIARRVNLISLMVVAAAGALAVYMLGGQVDSPTQMTVLGLVLAYLLFRIWRIWLR